MAAKRIKLNGRTYSQNIIDALQDMENGAQIGKDRTGAVMRRFGASPISCYLFWPQGSKVVIVQRLHSGNTHVTCQTIIDSGWVESVKYQKGNLGSSSTFYKLSQKGKQLLREYEDSGVSRGA